MVSDTTFTSGCDMSVPNWAINRQSVQLQMLNLTELNWIGRLFGFAQFTNTRILALVGDPDVPTYEIIFSFDTLKHRREFLNQFYS